MSADEIQKARFDALHVAEFTKDEMQAEIYMHALLKEGLKTEAWEAWGVFTLLEHYRAGLPANPADRSVTQLQTLAEYDMLARDEQAEFDKRVNVTIQVEEAFAYIDEQTAKVLRNLE